MHIWVQFKDQLQIFAEHQSKNLTTIENVDKIHYYEILRLILRSLLSWIWGHNFIKLNMYGPEATADWCIDPYPNVAKIVIWNLTWIFAYLNVFPPFSRSQKILQENEIGWWANLRTRSQNLIEKLYKWKVQ